MNIELGKRLSLFWNSPLFSTVFVRKALFNQTWGKDGARVGWSLWGQTREGGIKHQLPSLPPCLFLLPSSLFPFLPSLLFEQFFIEYILHSTLSIQLSSVAQLCPTLSDSMNRSTPGFPVHHQLLESTQTHVHFVGAQYLTLSITTS